MEICCLFQSIARGVFGADSKDRKHDIRVVPLLACSKDISQHREMFLFCRPENEVDLIPCRAGIFTREGDLRTMTNCPPHRARLGLGWTNGAAAKHTVPSAEYQHLCRIIGKRRETNRHD